jgi:hypothetical protein
VRSGSRLCPRRAQRDAAAKDVDEEHAALMEQLEIDFADEQLKLKLDQWNEVSKACGMASPDDVLRRHRAKLQKANERSAEDELLAFKRQKQAEQEAIAARLQKESVDTEARLAQAMEARRQAQERELKEKEEAVIKRIEQDKAKRERFMMDQQAKSGSSSAAVDQQAKIKERLIAESKRDEERLRENLQKERERQEAELQERMRRKRERDARKKEALEQLRTADAGAAEGSSSVAADDRFEVTRQGSRARGGRRRAASAAGGAA